MGAHRIDFHSRGQIRVLATLAWVEATLTWAAPNHHWVYAQKTPARLLSVCIWVIKESSPAWPGSGNREVVQLWKLVHEVRVWRDAPRWHGCFHLGVRPILVSVTNQWSHCPLSLTTTDPNKQLPKRTSICHVHSCHFSRDHHLLSLERSAGDGTGMFCAKLNRSLRVSCDGRCGL